MAEAPAAADLSSIRLAFSAGTALPRPFFDAFLDKFGVPVRQLYGCTEAGTLTANLDDDPVASFESVGKPVRGRGGADRGRGGPARAARHGGRDRREEPGAHLRLLRHGGAEPPGLPRWLLPQRRPRAARRGGSPDDHRSQEAADRGRAATRSTRSRSRTWSSRTRRWPRPWSWAWGPRSPARSRSRPSSCPATRWTRSELIGFCQQRLANFKVPQVVEFREEIPKSPLGKILRKYLI